MRLSSSSEYISWQILLRSSTCRKMTHECCCWVIPWCTVRTVQPLMRHFHRHLALKISVRACLSSGRGTNVWTLPGIPNKPQRHCCPHRWTVRKHACVVNECTWEERRQERSGPLATYLEQFNNIIRREFSRHGALELCERQRAAGVGVHFHKSFAQLLHLRIKQTLGASVNAKQNRRFEST